MTCVIFSIGEPTTDMCYKALKRQGVIADIWQDDSSFQDKFSRMCDIDDDVLRVDADIIVNDNLYDYLEKTEQINDAWLQPKGLVWWSQTIEPISVNYFPKSILKIFKKHLSDDGFKNFRPERYMWGLPELKDKIQHVDDFVGIKGYGIRELTKTIDTKVKRGQYYDWQWIKDLNSL